MRYTPLTADPSHTLPLFPPSYDDLDDNNDDYTYSSSATPAIEQFELDDGIDGIDDGITRRTQREGLLVRASLMTKKFANNFNNSIIHPVLQIIDPIYEGYKYFQQKYEQNILKLGNPLVVKRLLYVLFIMIVIFFVTKHNVNDGVNGTSGGTFSAGKFYNIDKLSSSVDDFISAKLMKENLEYFSSMSHITGSNGDLTLARYIETYMHNNGIRIMDMNQLQSYTNYPVYNEKDTYLKLLDNSFSAHLYEMNNKTMEHLAYNPNALNTNGPVESHFIYGNYGTQEDYQKLISSGIDLTDAILLIKYGGSIPEPNKVSFGQQSKVKAIVFITPKFEFGTGDSKQEFVDVIQKANVGLTRVDPGDVLTPGWSSEDGYVTRLPWFRSSTTPKIPTIPISWEDGEKLLSKLEGSGVKFDDGYFSGKGKSSSVPTMVLKIANEERATHQIWNVVGSIQGREQNEKGIIIGSSRDSTCYGTISSNTGTVVMLEMIKVFTSLQRKYNWSPSRSIYFVSFDATEYNLAGSAEWIENRKDLLRKEGYAYIDLSDAISGDDLSIKASPFVEDVIKKALKQVETDVTKNDNGNEKLSLYDLYLRQQGNDGISNDLIELKNYIPFINLVNMPSLELKFSGKKYPKNSCYDNFENFEKSAIDPDMNKHRELVKVLSLIALRLAESPMIPFDFQKLASKLTHYVDDLEKYSRDIILTLEQENKPVLHFKSLRDSIEILRNAANSLQSWGDSWKQYVENSAEIEPSMLAMNRWKRNENMVAFNQKFLVRNHMKDTRPGFANVLFGVPFMAPEVSDGKYEWNTFPRIRDSLYLHDFNAAQDQINKLASLVQEACQELDSQ